MGAVWLSAGPAIRGSVGMEILATSLRGTAPHYRCHACYASVRPLGGLLTAVELHSSNDAATLLDGYRRNLNFRYALEAEVPFIPDSSPGDALAGIKGNGDVSSSDHLFGSNFLLAGPIQHFLGFDSDSDSDSDSDRDDGPDIDYLPAQGLTVGDSMEG
eukprot:scaffold6362_cov378-Prasinococcus_capsulatus_cf.AAC.5